MFLPDIPLWCWNLLGEDAVRLSQPLHWMWGTQTTRFFSPDTCVARCQHEDLVSTQDGSTRSFSFLCGHVALLLHDGLYLCRLHSSYYRLGCAWCEEYAARGVDQACPGCHALWREIGAPCWCTPACGEAPAP